MVDSNALRERRTMSSTALREFCEADAREINRLAVRHFRSTVAATLVAAAYERMSELAKTGEIVVARAAPSSERVS
jgi:hypothetical protein